MLKGDFKSVTKASEIIGFIHRRYDGCYEATVVGYDNRTESDALDTEKLSRAYVKRKNKERWKP